MKKLGNERTHKHTRAFGIIAEQVKYKADYISESLKERENRHG